MRFIYIKTMYIHLHIVSHGKLIVIKYIIIILDVRRDTYIKTYMYTLRSRISVFDIRNKRILRYSNSPLLMVLTCAQLLNCFTVLWYVLSITHGMLID